MKLPVDLDALGASALLGFCQGGRDGSTGPEVHLVRGLPVEGKRQSNSTSTDTPQGDWHGSCLPPASKREAGGTRSNPR